MPAPDNPGLVELSMHGVHRRARCWEIVASAGTFRYTDHDVPLEVDGNTYSPAGAGGSASETTTDGKGNSVEVRGVITDAAVSEEDIAGGLFDGATVTEYIVDHRYPFAGKFKTRVYKIGEIRHNAKTGRWAFDIVGWIGQLERAVGHRNSVRCRYRLYDADTCGVTKASFTTTITVATVNADGSFTATPAAFDTDGYFDDGEITWSSGDNNGTTQSVRTYTSDDVTWYLHEKPPKAVQVGDQASVSAGCNHLAGVFVDGSDDLTGHCKHKFANLPNFGGYPYTPTDDVLYQTPDAKAEDDG